MKSKIYGAIMGLIVGDALGVPFEFKQRDTFRCDGMMGFGTYNQPPGTWSDDSSMTLATIDSIIKNNGKVIPKDIMNNFCKWLYKAEFTPYGKVFDAGNTTQIALERYYYGSKPINECGARDVRSNGNGALMRILPLAFADFGDGSNIQVISSLTHAHRISTDACEIYINIAEGLASGEDLNISMGFAALENYKGTTFERLTKLETLSRDEIRSSGYVVDTLEAALWCLLKTDNYTDAILTAVNLGDDTDTVAAVAGGLAGMMYGVGGEKGIPEEWIKRIAKLEYIEKLISKLENTISEA